MLHPDLSKFTTLARLRRRRRIVITLLDRREHELPEYGIENADNSSVPIADENSANIPDLNKYSKVRLVQEINS